MSRSTKVSGSQAGRQERREGPIPGKRCLPLPLRLGCVPPFSSRAGGQMSDTPTLTAQDLGWHGFTPGQSDARRIGTVASNLLLTLLAGW